MARPIKETPRLTGEDALKFIEEMKNIKPVTQEEMKQIKKDSEFLMSKAKFTW